ncbi:MAG: hypothetical protein JWM59_2955 [Verrucomicrobiales bacterium]|nr:hypothetical protein [Verrucomicrobiales bacterium]
MKHILPGSVAMLKFAPLPLATAVAVLMTAAVGVPAARACLWDSETMATESEKETIATEKGRFPEALQVLTGGFPRHSALFHEWRAAKCLKALKGNPGQPALYDDLAVSQHKLGRHREAVATMRQKESVAPGLYETWSNLGTFYIYTGELKEAVACIDKALGINPNAHFGREKYQRWLVLWLMERQAAAAGREPPARESAGKEGEEPPCGFARFVLNQQTPAGVRWTEEDRAPAIKGILGMMRFADFDNPLLQEALGDVLISGDWERNSAVNAAFAYCIASTKAAEAAENRRLFGRFAVAVMPLGEKWTPKRVGKDVRALLAKGTALEAKVRRDEAAWLAAGKDLSVEFARKYLTSGGAGK